MTNEQALQVLENVSKMWLGSLGDKFAFEQAATVQQALQVLKVAITPKPQDKKK